MDENVSGTDKSEDLRVEMKQLKMNLERSNIEKANAAEYGLAILEEKNMLKSLLDQKEILHENLRAQLACTQEALVSMQQHNKALEEADIAEEEKRMIQEEIAKKEREDLENELRSYRKELAHYLEERDKLEELLKQNYSVNEKSKIQLKKIKEELKDCESRESFALKNCDTLESDNLELQLQVSHLFKSFQQFDTIQLENKRLQERVDGLTVEMKRHNTMKTEMEKSLQETNEMLREERELKMRYKRELDSRVLSDEGTFLNASTVASIHSLIGGASSMIGDVSVDNITALLDGFMTLDDEDDDDDDGKIQANMKDSLEDLDDEFKRSGNNNNKRMKGRNKKRNDLMSELMMTHEEYVLNIEKLEVENLKLNKIIEDLKDILESEKHIKFKSQLDDKELINSESLCKSYFNAIILNVSTPRNNFFNTTLTHNKSCQPPKHADPPVQVQTSSMATQTDESNTANNENMEDVLRCLQNLRMVLLDMVNEAQSTYTTLCNAAEESLNSKAMIHVDARKAAVQSKIGRSDEDVLKNRIPSFVLSKSLPRNIPVVDESVWTTEVDCTKLLASSIDLMRYSRRVANRMLDIKVAVRARESSSSLVCSSFSSSSSFSNGHPAVLHLSTSACSSNLELHEQIFRLQSLLAAKSEQMMSLRQMLSANKSVYESSIEKLKQQHDNEMKARWKMVEDLKRSVDELKEKEGMKFASEQTLIKQCDQYSSQMNDLRERLDCSELERKTLNSLLRIAIQHKLVLLKRLQSHGMSVDIFPEHDTDVDVQSEHRRPNLPSPRHPMRSRYLNSPPSSSTPSSWNRSSFTPLLYNSSKHA